MAQLVPPQLIRSRQSPAPHATLVLWVALLSIRFWQVRLPSHSIKQLLVFELQLVFPGQLFAPVQ
jgi:hypothetical protein